MASLFNVEVGLYRFNQATAVAINTNTFDLDLGEVLNNTDGVALSLHVVGLGTSGVLTVTQSNNETANFVATTGENVNSGAVVSTVNAAGLYVFPVAARFIRVTMTTATTGGTTDLRVSAVPGANYRQMYLLNQPSINNNPSQRQVDVASSALTTTTTTSATAPWAGLSYQAHVVVTAVSGTSPTLDVSVEESMDDGTNWTKVWDFPRITAAGIYHSPYLPNRGSRVRYVQTVGGTTPSFTRAIGRMQANGVAQATAQLIDRTIAVNTLNSVTPALEVTGCDNQIKVAFNTGAGATTAPQLQLEGTEDNGATWVSIGAPIVAVASSTVTLSVTGQSWQRVRGRISTAGVAATGGYALIRAHD